MLIPFNSFSEPGAIDAGMLLQNKKTDMAHHLIKALHHVGLLFNWPPDEPGCHLFSRPTTSFYLARIR